MCLSDVVTWDGQAPRSLDLRGILSVLLLARGALVCACYERWASFQRLCSPYASVQWFFTTRQDIASSREFADSGHSIETGCGPHFTLTGP